MGNTIHIGDEVVAMENKGETSGEVIAIDKNILTIKCKDENGMPFEKKVKAEICDVVYENPDWNKN